MNIIISSDVSLRKRSSKPKTNFISLQRTSDNRKRVFGISAAAPLALLLLSAPTAQADSNIRAPVKVVNVNSDWGGFMVQLDTASQFNEGADCTSPWAFMLRTDPLYKDMLATLIAAQLSGTSVWVFTRGCYRAGISPIPQLIIVDLGVRQPGT